jgi:hypothetical protein
MRSLASLLRPGGVIAFQDACWGTWLDLNKRYSLRWKCVSLIDEAFACSGAHMDMERVLFQAVQEAGLPSPTMRIEVPIGDDPDIVRYAHDLFSTLLPRIREYGLSLNEVGDLETLSGADNATNHLVTEGYPPTSGHLRGGSSDSGFIPLWRPDWRREDLS